MDLRQTLGIVAGLGHCVSFPFGSPSDSEIMSKQPKKLKRVPLKEELVALSGDFIKALILQQFLYWSERVTDFDAFIVEEKERSPELEIELRHGWIYKSTDELHKELMLGDSLSTRTLKRRIDEIVSEGYLANRNNPNHKWDRCLQYRPDIQKIQTDLQKLGYSLEGYPLFVAPIAFDTVSNASDTMTNRGDKVTNQTVTSDQALTETTIKTTTIETKKASSAKADYSRPVSLLSEKEVKLLELGISAWQQYLTDEQAERGRKGVIKFIEGKIRYWGLLPHNSFEITFFEVLREEYEADGKDPPKKFPCLETKRLFNEAAEFHNGTLESVIKKAIHKRGKGIKRIVDYINSPNWKDNSNGQKNGDRSSSQSSSGQANGRGFQPGNGRTPEMQAALERAFAPKPG